jgi:glycine cleavage system transcriptional repressor
VNSASVSQVAVSALGRDQPGIVAAITGVLVAHRLNIADSQMGVLCGRFSIMLIVDAPEGFDLDALRADLERAAGELRLDAIGAYELSDEGGAEAFPTHMVTVYGVDHPGIVNAVAHELAARGVNITDLNTRRVADEGEEPLYAMMLEVASPELVDEPELRQALERVADRQGVEVTVRELDSDAL